MVHVYISLHKIWISLFINVSFCCYLNPYFITFLNYLLFHEIDCQWLLEFHQLQIFEQLVSYLSLLVQPSWTIMFDIINPFLLRHCLLNYIYCYNFYYIFISDCSNLKLIYIKTLYINNYYVFINTIVLFVYPSNLYLIIT